MNIVPFSHFQINVDENNCHWIVDKRSSMAFASQSALAWMCEITPADVSGMVNKGKNCPKALLDIDLSGMVNIENPFGGTPVFAIPADICYDVLYYYATEARGHEKRKSAKELCKRMGKAGATIFVYKMAGYTIKVDDKEEPQNELPQASPEERLSMATDALKTLGIDFDNPRYSQGLRDWSLNLLGIQSQNALPPQAEWKGAAERAEELGFGKVGADSSLRVRLGQYVALCNLERKKEKRICNGQDRSIWVYKVCEQLDTAIAEFLGKN